MGSFGSKIDHTVVVDHSSSAGPGRPAHNSTSQHCNHPTSTAASYLSRYRNSGNSNRIAAATDIQLQVAHFTPCCFPMIPIVTVETMEICRGSWAKVLANVEKDGQKISGMTVFYTEFYRILGIMDHGCYFEKALKAHAVGKNAIAAKGGIIIRVVNYTLSVDPENTDQMERNLRRIGKSHKQYNIRPWMYQGFVEALLTTFHVVLGPLATSDVMGAWCNLLALVTQFMLPYAIDGLANPHEIDANYSGSFLSAKACSIRSKVVKQDSATATSHSWSIFSTNRTRKSKGSTDSKEDASQTIR
jgi:hypothetical protein